MYSVKNTGRFLLLLTVMVVVAVCATTAKAMTMSPLEMELTAGGTSSRTQFQVRNDSDKPLPIEITFDSLSYTEAGERKTRSSADDLLIFPATAMIPPGGTQTFRVQYVGSPDIITSKTFLVNARQLPVKMKSDGKSHVQIVNAFGAIFNVAPLTGTAMLNLVSSSPARIAAGQPALSILVENPTNVHALIANAALSVGNQKINPETMRANVGFGVVEPHKRRRFLVPLQAPASGQAKLEYRTSPR